jgi:serine/threonine-protein kinase
MTGTDEGRGRRLEDWLRREQSLSLGEIGPVVDGVLGALVALHERGQVHRNVQPSTIILLDDGVRLSDAHVSSTGFPLDRFDVTLGRFAYMAPELVRGAKTVDARVDVYAVGATVFRALTGRPAFEGSSAIGLVVQKLERDAPRLATVTGRTWPAPVEDFVACSLARDPGARLPSAHEALVRWRRLFD